MFTPALLVPSKGTPLYKYILVEALDIVGDPGGISARFEGKAISRLGTLHPWVGGCLSREYSFRKPQALIRYVYSTVRCSPLDNLFPNYRVTNGREVLLDICSHRIKFQGKRIEDLKEVTARVGHLATVYRLQQKSFNLKPTVDPSVWVCGDYCFNLDFDPDAEKLEVELRQEVLRLMSEGNYTQVSKMLKAI